ncbi:chemotaxis protein CheB [Melittangium boletus]|uniref:chemotaxis protein CheB n=1 Tax=Melittangium boletus TaxID=83453 RepID=UPI003DA600F0
MRRELAPTWLVVVASSSGGLPALCALVSALPADLPAAVLVVSHTSPTSQRRLPTLLSAAGPLPAAYADEGQPLARGTILVAPPDRHLVVQGRGLRLTGEAKEHLMRPAADVLFRSAARAFGARCIGIVLSGGGQDAAAGLAEIQAAGGHALIQAPEDARLAMMPLNALARVTPDACVPAAELGALVARLVCERGTPRAGPPPAFPSLKGLRVLLAEDDHLIASEVVVMLHGLGCGVVGPVADLEVGLRLLERERGRLDCAVLDVDLRGEWVLPLAMALTWASVPFLLATGYGEDILPEAWEGAPRLQKPYDMRALGTALRRALRLRWFPLPEATVAAPRGGFSAEPLKDSRNLLMRSHVLRAASTGQSLSKSYEAIRRTHECIARSALRTDAARRMLHGRAPSEPGAEGKAHEDDT